MNQQHVNCPSLPLSLSLSVSLSVCLSLSLSLSHTLILILANTQAREHARTYKGLKGSLNVPNEE